MIYNKGREITEIYQGNKTIKAVYKGAQLVWQAVRSCFGKGFWINEKPWNNQEGWS